MSTVQDDVRASIETLESQGSDTAQAPAPVSPPAAAPAPALAPAPAPAAEAKTPVRDATGRFVSNNAGLKEHVEAATTEAAKEEAQKATVIAATSAKDVSAQTTEAKAPPTPTDEERGEIKLDPAKPPQGWTAPMKEKWASIPEDIRGEITRREQDMAAGVQRLNQQYEPLRQVGSALQAYDPYFQHIQKPPQQYLQELIPIEQTLALGNPAQKLDMLLNVADKYGVPIRNVLNQAMGGKLGEAITESHKSFGSPTPIPPQVQQELVTLRTQMDNIQNLAAKSELDTFIADATNHPYFDNVREDMAKLLETGACTTYQEAYDISVWRNPDLRAHVLAQANGQQQAAGIQQRQAAAAVAVPPAAASIGRTQPAKDDGTGDVYDDVRRAWEVAASGARA
jgi:hypothetical protein